MRNKDLTKKNLGKSKEEFAEIRSKIKESFNSMGKIRNSFRDVKMILDDNDETDNTDLRYISHIMGVYFDKLYSQIKDLPKLRHQTHTSGSFKPVSFAEHLPQSLGLYSPEIFIDATVTEKFLNQSEQDYFENDLAEAKNLIYQNLCLLILLCFLKQYHPSLSK